MKVHEVQNFLQHLVDLLFALANLTALQRILLAVLIHAKTRGPHDESHGDELARYKKRVRIAFDKLDVSLAEL